MTLNRETLRALETVHGVAGGTQFSVNTAGCASIDRCGGGGGGGTYGACGNSAENCSDFCATGGACTV